MQHEAAEDAADAQHAASQQQAERARLEQRRADIQNARTVRAAIRQARVARAAIINTGANSGTSGSSGVLGGAGSVQAQLGSNLGYFGAMGELNTGVFQTQVGEAEALSSATQSQASAAGWGALGQLGGSIFAGAGGFKTIFSK